jgi:hypothetical protein
MHKRNVQIIIVSLLLLAPIININELLWSIGLREGERAELFTVKLIKDIGILFIILSSIFSIFESRRVPKTYLILPFVFLFLTICILASMENSGMIHILAGLRWSLPLFLFIFLHDSIDKEFMGILSCIILILLVLNTSLQVVELWYMPPYDGETYFGLSARVPGMFSHVSSCGSFIVLSYITIDEFMKKNILRKIGKITAIIGVILSMSSTGMIGLITVIYLGSIRESKWYNILVCVIPLVVLLTYTCADTLTNRSEGSSESSIGSRKEFFITGLKSTGMISHTFGYATNVIIQLSEKASAADAFYPSVLINLGILPFLSMIFIVMIFLIIALVQRDVFVVSIITLYGLCSFSIIIPEVFPINLFLAVFTSYRIAIRRNSKAYYTLR